MTNGHLFPGLAVFGEDGVNVIVFQFASFDQFLGEAVHQGPLPTKEFLDLFGALMEDAVGFLVRFGLDIVGELVFRE